MLCVFGIEIKICCLFSESVLTCCNWKEDKPYAEWFFFFSFYFLALSDSNLMGAWEELQNIFSENKPLMCLINFSTSAPISPCVFLFLPRELQRKQVLHWNDKFCRCWETRWFSQLKPLRVVNITVLRLHGRRTKSSEANTGRSEGGSGRGLPRHIDLCSAASKGIDGFRLPPWLTFTLGMSCFYLSNQCVILIPTHNLLWCLALRRGACVAIFFFLPFGRPRVSAQRLSIEWQIKFCSFFFFKKKKKTYFDSCAVSQATEAASR